MSVDHDYSDKYYLGEQNPFPHADVKIEKVRTRVNDGLEEGKGVTAYLKSKLVLGMRDTNILNAMPGTEVVLDKMLDQQQIELKTSEEFNALLQEFVTKTDFNQLYESIQKNSEEISLTDICLLQELLLHRGSGDQYDKLLGGSFDRSTLMSAVAGKIRLGSDEVIKDASEVLSWNSKISKELYCESLPRLAKPLENVANHISLAKKCIQIRKVLFSQNGLQGLKEWSGNNEYLEDVCEAVSTLPESGRGVLLSEVHDLLRDSVDVYTPYLKQINNDTMDHDHMIQLFSSFIHVRSAGVDVDDVLPQAKQLFSNCLKGLYTPRFFDRYLQHNSDLIKICDALELPRDTVTSLFVSEKTNVPDSTPTNANDGYFDDL